MKTISCIILVLSFIATLPEAFGREVTDQEAKVKHAKSRLGLCATIEDKKGNTFDVYRIRFWWSMGPKGNNDFFVKRGDVNVDIPLKNIVEIEIDSSGWTQVSLKNGKTVEGSVPKMKEARYGYFFLGKFIDTGGDASFKVAKTIKRMSFFTDKDYLAIDLNSVME